MQIKKKITELPPYNEGSTGQRFVYRIRKAIYCRRVRMSNIRDLYEYTKKNKMRQAVTMLLGTGVLLSSLNSCFGLSDSALTKLQ